MEVQLSISDIFRRSLQSAKAQMWILAGLLIGYIILSMTLSAVVMPMQESIVGNVIVNIVMLLFSSVFAMGYIKNHFQALDGMEPQFSAYIQESRKVITYIIAVVLYALIVTVGLLLFVIPGIYLGLRLQFFLAFIIEENAGSLSSMQRSWQITQDHSGSLFLLFLAMVGISIVGVCLFIVGVFFTIPITYQMYCASFRLLNTPLQYLNDDK